MLKRERMEIVSDLQGLKDVLSQLAQEDGMHAEDINDCLVVSQKVDEIIDYVENSSKIHGDIMVRITKLKNITKTFKAQMSK